MKAKKRRTVPPEPNAPSKPARKQDPALLGFIMKEWPSAGPRILVALEKMEFFSTAQSARACEAHAEECAYLNNKDIRKLAQSLGQGLARVVVGTLAKKAARARQPAPKPDVPMCLYFCTLRCATAREGSSDVTCEKNKKMFLFNW